MPLIITHGWPGSVIEMLDVIGPLTDPTAYGGGADEGFDLIVPSLPGFGFSGQPTELGWNPARVARAWAELMQRLGYTRYVAQGGDIGATVTDELARLAPAGLAGITSTSSARSRSKSGRRSLADFCRPVFSRGW
jgi:pimeloyl-ACP methyl ester carboxylesterase